MLEEREKRGEKRVCECVSVCVCYSRYNEQGQEKIIRLSYINVSERLPMKINYCTQRKLGR